MSSPVNPVSSNTPAVQSPLLQLGQALQTGDIFAAREAYRAVSQQAASNEETRTTPKPASRPANFADMEVALRKDALSAAQLVVSPVPANMGRPLAGYAATNPKPSVDAQRAALGTLMNQKV